MISTALTSRLARPLAFAAGSLVLCLMGFVPDADADPDGLDAHHANGVELKTAIERHYIAKIERLLAPSFTTTPAVSVDVELDLTRVERVTSKDDAAGNRTAETIVNTPGAILKKHIAVALPMDELPAGMGLESFRRLISSGCNLGAEDRLELLALPAQAVAAAPVAGGLGSRPTVPARSAWEDAAPLLGVGTHVLWAAVAIVVALLGWSVLRQIADRPPADPILASPAAPFAPPQPVVVNVPGPPAPAPLAPPKTTARPVLKPARGGPSPKPLPKRDPMQDVQERIAHDPVRAAEALAGWINA